MEDFVENAQQVVAPFGSPSGMLCSNPDLLWFSDEFGAIVFNPETQDVNVLNPRASLLLLLCDGTRNRNSVLSVANEIEPLKDNRASFEKDSRWIEQSQRDELIVESDASGCAPKSISFKKLRKIANSLLESHELIAAKRCADYLVQEKPNKSKNWYLLGDTEHALGNFPAAKSAYEKYLELDPENLTIAHLVTALSGDKPPSKASADYVRQTFDDYAESFDKSLIEDLGYRTPELIVEALEKYLPMPEKQFQIADLGCGTGLMGKAIAPWARTTCGVDLSSQMMSKALLTKHYNEIHVAEIAEWLKSEYRKFDLVVAADVFVYFGDLQEVVDLVRKKLNENSIFAFSVELSDKPGFDLTVSGRYAHHPDYIKEIAQNSGFRIVSMQTKTLRLEYGKDVTGLVVVFKS